MRVALYRRVSTEMQKEEGFSLEAQKIRLESFAFSQGWEIVEDYCDDGYSAKSLDRPALQRLISDMKQKKFDVILVYRLDRFVRSVRDLHELLELMEKYDVKFKSSTEVFDTTTASGRLFITMIATLAQWERETIAERVYENMLKRSEQGKWNGGTIAYGYSFHEGKLVINEEEARWVRYIYDKYKTTGSQNIAKILNRKGIRTKKGEVWSDFAVRYVLKNPIYCGKVRWNRRSLAKGKLTGEEVIRPIEQDDFVPIISDAQFQETQRLLKERSQTAFKSDEHYPFSGVAKCAICGNSFSGAKKKRKDGSEYRFYKCNGRFRTGVCDLPTLAEESFENAFLAALDIPEVTVPYEEAAATIQDTDMIQKQLDKIARKKKRMKELYVEMEDMTREEYLDMMEELNQQEKELTDLLVPEEELNISAERLMEGLRNIKKEWHHLSNEYKKAAIRSLFEYITFEVIEKAKPGKYPVPAVLNIKDYRFKT